jgi:hypothetical protein
MTLAEILASVSQIADQASGIATNVQAIALPSIQVGSPVPAQVELTSSGEPGKSNVVTYPPMMKWYVGGAIALVVLYVVLKK